MPQRPEAMAADRLMYGLASAAATRYSTRCDFGLPEMTRRAHVRLSTLHAESVGAQNPGINRVYELTVGEIMARNSGMSCCWPPRNQRMTSLIPCGALASWNTGLPAASRSDMWMCPL